MNHPLSILSAQRRHLLLLFAILLWPHLTSAQDSTNAPAPSASVPAKPSIDPQKALSKLAYHFTPSIFTTREFPPGALLQDAIVQKALGPIQVATTFYNDKFEEVKEAASPGRYGAVVRLTLADGTQLNRFLTLYRIPDGAPTQLLDLGSKIKAPVESGTGPEVAARQQEEIATALKDAAGSNLLNGSHLVPILAALAKVSPGTDPDQLLANFMAFTARDDAWWFDLRKRLGLAETYPFLINLPEGYAADPAKRWPLILFLHGSGARGNNLEAFKHNGVPQGLAARKLPAILVSPQCPNEGWSAPVLAQLLDDLSAKYHLDPDRIIVTGASMGGFGTWALAQAYPDRFAAIVPICGGGNPAAVAPLSHLPIWAFHGQLDPTVPVQMSQAMATAIQQAGGTPHLTIYPAARHDSWTQAYATDALYTWMLAQQRGHPEVKTPGLPEP